MLRIKELQDQVDKVLFYEWDPLGVSTMDYMRDEYSRYVLEVVEIAFRMFIVRSHRRGTRTRSKRMDGNGR